MCGVTSTTGQILSFLSLLPDDTCCPSVQQQQWVTIYICAAWHLSPLPMKKPSCPTSPRSLRSLISVNELTESSWLFLYCYCRSGLKQESALFMDQALSIFRTLTSVVSSFNNEQEQMAARRMLAKSHRPQSSTSLRKHNTVTGPVTSNKKLNTWH